VKLVIAGNGDEQYLKSLKEYIERNNLSNIYFAGNLTKDDLKIYYEGSTLSIVPSLVYDNMPNSALESMAFGTPVIAPDNGSFPEIVFDNVTGFLYEYGNLQVMAEKIRDYLLQPKLQQEMRLKSREFIELNHSAKGHYKLLMCVIEKVIRSQKEKNKG
jgi:glycosyltransferase involved in cell wall biosynthesis